MTYEQFIKRERLSMECKPIASNPNMDEDRLHPMNHWLCNIKVKNGDIWPVPFSMGNALQGPPELPDVLDCLASDAAGFDNARTFEEWASEYGYDSDSRKAERIYNTIEEQSEDMRVFLGDAAYQDLLYNTERL